MSSRTEKIEIYREASFVDRFNGVADAPQQWRWRYKATNGKILADGGEGYAARADAVRGALRVTGLDIPTYVGRLSRLAEVHWPTPYGVDLLVRANEARLTWLLRGRVYYFFDSLITDRPYDVELVQL
jgi:uncharacterized protein YegP (UPF0339 family)